MWVWGFLVDSLVYYGETGGHRILKATSLSSCCFYGFKLGMVSSDVVFHMLLGQVKGGGGGGFWCTESMSHPSSRG